MGSLSDQLFPERVENNERNSFICKEALKGIISDIHNMAAGIHI